MWPGPLCVTRALGSGPFSLRRSLSACAVLSARRKSSEYSSVDLDRYSSLVRAVVSCRTSAQTPGSLLREDERLFGTVIRSRPGPEPKALRNPCPLLNRAKTSAPSEYQGEMTRITVQRVPDQPHTPSVTRILQETMSETQRFYLDRWRRRKVAELGEDGFKEYSQNLFRQGHLFHASIEAELTQEQPGPQEPAEGLEDVDGYLHSIRHVLEDVSGVRAIESAVEHQSLCYLGVVDCVALYRGSLCVIDWKTSEKPKPLLRNTYDNPLQVAAYIGALNSDNNYNYQVENGLIVVAYRDGSPAHSHFLNTEQVSEYWEKWLFRLEEYREKAL
ncbi:mitochondrial genome maintenance exonuclease 1 [Hoplias malabaricus]|uniref:mitochondrial genome maintenance exonuclease 1 n=1 Tax=Hoplias malabaricus TaxID=27720 RepID=UPI0034629F66